MSRTFSTTRRQLLAGAAASAAYLSAPGILRGAWAQDKPFKIGLLVDLSGPTALFGASMSGSAALAADQVNAAGGIAGREVTFSTVDSGAAPPDVARAVTRLMLDEKVDLLIGSHNSAVRQAVEGAVRSRVPYLYTSVFEGQDCTPNVYFLGETPDQQIRPTVAHLLEQGAKSFYLVGNDYVWGRRTNEAAANHIKAGNGTVVGEEYVPLGAPNRFEEIVTRIRSAKPDVVVLTVIGADNVNFNRTFAGFGLDKDIARIAYLLEENTLQGIGADNSANLYSCMAYFANVKTPENEAFKAAMKKKFGDKMPQLSTLGADTYAGVNMAKALVEKAGGTDPKKLAAASEGLSVRTAAGTGIMRGRYLDKDMYLARCEGTEFEVIKTFEMASSGESCPV